MPWDRTYITFKYEPFAFECYKLTSPIHLHSKDVLDKFVNLLAYIKLLCSAFTLNEHQLHLFNVFPL